MQVDNQNFSDFFVRSQHLAEKLGVRAVDLPEILGISKAMLFAYRKGKNPISWRAWRKLEAAERKAGIALEPDSKSSTDAATPSLPSPQNFNQEFSLIHQKLDRIDEKLSALARKRNQP